MAGAVVTVVMRWVIRAQESWWPSRRRAFSAYVESPRGRAARRRREARMAKVHARRVARGEIAPPVRPHG